MTEQQKLKALTVTLRAKMLPSGKEMKFVADPDCIEAAEAIDTLLWREAKIARLMREIETERRQMLARIGTAESQLAEMDKALRLAKAGGYTSLQELAAASIELAIWKALHPSEQHAVTIKNVTLDPAKGQEITIGTTEALRRMVEL